MFEEKEGNIQLALDWYNEGMKKGDINSTIRLGKIAEGNKDYEKAEELYLKTTNTKDARIIYNLVNLYFRQDRRQKVVEWQKKLMNEKQITGLTFEIIKNIEFMLGSEKDKKYVELINQGNEFLEKRDYENARKLFTEAINYNERGYLELAKSYYAEGKGEKTKEVFEKAYEMGVKETAYKLGQYMDVVEGNEKEAEKWYKIGKEIGDARAIYQLAILYETSREFGKSEEEAYGIFEISANMKYAPAIMDMAFYSDRAENKNKVKVIENDRERAEKLSEAYSKAIVIRGDEADQEFLIQEGIKNYDAVVIITDSDEENAVISMFANSITNAKLITKMNRTLLLPILENNTETSIVVPKKVISDMIISVVRSRTNMRSSTMSLLYRLENKVELITFEINKNSVAIDIPLKELKIKKGTLIASILRNGKMIFPGGNDMIKINDSVMIVSTIPSIEDFDEILERI